MAFILSEAAINKLKKRRDVKLTLCLEYGLDEDFGVRTVNRWIARNEPNGPLTSQTSILILSKHLLIKAKDVTTEIDAEGIRRRKAPKQGVNCEANC